MSPALNSHISYLSDVRSTPEKYRQSVPRSEEELGITPVSEFFPTDMPNLKTINPSSRDIPESQSNPELVSSEVNKYRGERKKLESSSGVENEYEASSGITTSSPRHQSTETNAISERKLANMHSDDLLPVKMFNNFDYSNNLDRFDSAPGGITESLNDYRVKPNSSEILTFFSIAAGVFFLVFIVYLSRCKRPHIQNHTLDNGIEKGTAGVSHLQVERLKIQSIHADILDDLW